MTKKEEPKKKKTAAKKVTAKKIPQDTTTKNTKGASEKMVVKKKKDTLDKKIQKIGSDANRSLSKYLQEISKYQPLEPRSFLYLLQALIENQSNQSHIQKHGW